MAGAATQADLKKSYQIAVMIGMALLAAAGMFVVIAELFKTGIIGGYEFPMTRDSEVYQLVKYVLMAVTLVDLLFIKIIGSKILSRGEADPASLMVKSIVSLAICESVAIYGLVLFLLAGSRFDFYLFIGIYLVFFGIFFPRYHKWEEWIRVRSPETFS